MSASSAAGWLRRKCVVGFPATGVAPALRSSPLRALLATHAESAKSHAWQSVAMRCQSVENHATPGDPRATQLRWVKRRSGAGREMEQTRVAGVVGPHLYLAGFGSSSPLQLTIEAQQTTIAVGSVLGLNLPERLRAMLERQGVEVESLDALLEGKPAATGCAAVGQAVLTRARNQPPIVFLAQGSPLFFNAISRFVLMEAQRTELPVRVFPGVSPVDVVVAELGIDVGWTGLQTLTATGLLARPTAVTPRMPLLLCELAGIMEGGSAEAFGPFVDALLQTYPDEQPVTLINLPGDGGISRATVLLANFAELIRNIDTSSCLFVDIRKKASGTRTTKE